MISLNKNNDKGVSLIMLVVTIIIMVILAGVTINTTLESGVIDKAEDLHIRTEFSELAEEWNTRRAELNMKNVSDEDINYPNIKTATIIIGETELQERVIRMVDISDELNRKIEIYKGLIVYKASECTEEEIEYFESQEVPEKSTIH